MMNAKWDRRRFLGLCCAGSASMLFAPFASAEAERRDVRKTTFAYKRIDGLEIHADVYRPDNDDMLPVAVWIHGGALINGHREGISSRVKDMLLDAGCVVVSIDYRLAPETKLPAIIEDVEDAFRWIRKQGPTLFRADTSRIAVLGGSAGGYLTLMSGFRVRPRPTVLISFWGYGDLVGDWYSTPSPHPRHHLITLTKEEADRQVNGPPIADSRNRKGNGGAFYQYCRQHGLWPKAVSGWDPKTETEKFIPYMPVRNVTKDYPPTLLVHGTHDTDVPYEQSVMMAEQLEKHGVEHALITIPEAEHGLAGGDPKRIDAAYHSALTFLNRHIKP